MDSTNVVKPCFVLIEQLTPEKQLALSAELRNAINERNILTTRTKQKILHDLDNMKESEKEEKVN